MRSNRIGLAVGAFITSLGALIAAPPSSGPAESPADLPESLRYSYPPVPPALWDEFVREVKSEGAFEAAQELRQEAIAPKVEQWSRQWGKPLEAEYSPFLELAGMQRNSGRLTLENLVASVAPQPSRSLRVPALPNETVSGVRAWVFRSRSGNQAFFVPASEAQALMFPVLRSVGSTHPLNEKLATFECDSDNLLAIAQRILNQTGIQYDYAFNNRFAAEAALSMRLSDRTRFECLKLAAEAANFELSTQAFGKDCSVRNPSVSFHEVRRAYQEKRDSQPAEPEEPIQILEKRLQEAIQVVQQGRDITIGLRPRFPSTDVKVNVDESGRRR